MGLGRRFGTLFKILQLLRRCLSSTGRSTWRALIARHHARSSLGLCLYKQTVPPQLHFQPWSLDTFAFVEREMGHAEASSLAHILDKAGAWSKVYQTLGDWRAAKAVARPELRERERERVNR